MKPVTAEQKRRAQTVAALLDEIIPNPNAALDYRSPFALLIATLLSAQCHDEQINRVMPTFLKRASSPEAVCALSEEEIGELIHSCGFFRVKAHYIATLSRQLCEKFNGNVPDDFSSLESLAGVGHKTASVVMGYAFGHPTFPVDTHVHRLALKWHLSSGSVEKVEVDLKRLFPENDWFRRHIQMITYGRKYCNRVVCKEGSLCRVCKTLEKI